jgi:glycosyltransferase involved in cell wall biosynthesis
VLLRAVCKLVSRRINYFFGVTNLRCDFLQRIYGINQNKIGLLPTGFDTDKINSISSDKIKLRNKYGIPEDSFVIISGGKMGKEKGTGLIIDAIKETNITNIHLVLFGSFQDEDTKSKAEECPNVSIIRWCDRTKTLELLNLSDLAIWPFLHTSLIEDAIGCSIPVIISKSGNTDHLIDGNGIFIENKSKEELGEDIELIENNYSSYKENSINKSRVLSYDIIAEIIYKKYQENKDR